MGTTNKLFHEAMERADEECAEFMARAGQNDPEFNSKFNLETIDIEWHTPAFTFGVSLLTGALFGVIPALLVSHRPETRWLLYVQSRP